MERKAIAVQGISTGSNYDDGACLNVMNMRHEQGVLKPVESFPVDYTLKHVYDFLYWHKNNDYAHLIGVRNNGIYWIQNPGEENEEEGTSLLAVTNTIIISHLGNIINVIDDETLKYMFWQDNSYFVIDMDFDGEQTDTTLGPVKVDLRVTNEIDSNNKPTLRYYRGTTLYSPLGNTDDSIDAKKQEYFGLISKSLSINNDDGYLNGFILACTAIELYDGSFILSSNPVLLCQSFDSGTRYRDIQIRDQSCNYENNKMIFYSGLYKDKTVNSKGYFTENRNNFYNLLNGDSVSGSSHETPILTGLLQNVLGVSCSRAESNDALTGDYLYCVTSLNKLQFKITNNIDIKYKSIIKSVSVFITQETNMQIFGSKDDIIHAGTSFFVFDGFKWDKVYNFTTNTLSDKDITEKIKSNQQFYKIKEIAFDDIVAGNWIDLTEDLKGKLGDNLRAQQDLIAPSFSNIKARSQMTYNSMLHAWDIKNVASRGWPLNYFIPTNGIGQFQPAIYTLSLPTDQLWYIEVLIKTGAGVSKVVRYSSLICPFSDLTNLVSYPNNMATQMIVYQFMRADGPAPLYLDIKKTSKKIFKLTASKTQNFAYYISPDLKPILFSPLLLLAKETVPTESNQQLSYQNKLKVSNTNNPFLFPDAQTYQIGDGTILNVASQSIRTSDGQFGQYPLVCFCTDGVFTLQVGDGTVAYSKVGTPQNYERPISKVICVTPYGIAFISNRGLCMVVGQDIEYLSESMFEKFRTITLELPDQIENLFALDLSSFNDYLKACTAMVYNPKEQEIIMINSTKAYNYVYNMSTKQFYRNVEAITNEINNSLPDMQVWTGATVKKVTVVETGSREISFVTRPIKMQTPDMKRFERVILRAYLSGITGTPATACIWGSIDDRNFKLLRGMVLENNSTRKDIDFGLFGKTTYRSYIIGLSMTVGTDSEIEAIEMQVEKEFLDTKMR